jgi:hypothetical protein
MLIDPAARLPTRPASARSPMRRPHALRLPARPAYDPRQAAARQLAGLIAPIATASALTGLARRPLGPLASLVVPIAASESSYANDHMRTIAPRQPKQPIL